VLGRLLARLADRGEVTTLAELDAWLADRDAVTAAAAARRHRVRGPLARLLRPLGRLLRAGGRVSGHGLA
jgi:hypothetical protein